MKNKLLKLNGVFKNIPGKGKGESFDAKKNWFSNNLYCDFICCQETKTRTHDETSAWFPLSWKENVFCSLNDNVDTAQGGVLIAINPKSKLKYISHESIGKGRVIIVKAKWRGVMDITIVNVYLHSGETVPIVNARNKLIQDIKNNHTIKNAKHLIIGGDWNSIRHESDSTNPRHSLKSKQDLEELEENLDLYDHVAYYDEDTNCYTRISSNSDNIYMTRLDRIMINRKTLKFLNTIWKEDAGKESDHDTIKIQIVNKTDYPAKAQWYFPNALLDDPKFIKDFTEAWNNKKWNNTSINNSKWEQCKNWIRKFTVDWTKKPTNNTKDMKKLKKTLSILKHKATTDTKRYPTTEAFINIIKDKIHKLSIDQQKTKHENYSYLDQIHREKATKPYFTLERNMRMNQDRIITELKNNNTQRSYTRSREIVELAARPYYKNLYDCKSTKAEAQIKALDSINKIIPPELRKSMAKALTQEEIEAAIENLAKGKAPGSDGITIDFFKKFKTLGPTT